MRSAGMYDGVPPPKKIVYTDGLPSILPQISISAIRADMYAGMSGSILA